MRSILCGVDASSQSIDALRFAAQLARSLSVHVELLHVDPEPRPEALFAPPPAWTAPPPPSDERWSALATDLRGEPVAVHYATGEPAAKLIEFAHAHDCGMIVLGSRAHRAASLALGSVVGKVLTHADCPVVVIPLGAEELKSDFPGQAA